MVISDIMTDEESSRLLFLQYDNMYQLYAKKNHFDFVYEYRFYDILAYYRW